ncbi:glycosyl hydrolase family 28-related protein [Tunturiibacter gelidoferens]|uniref:Uncharacterized protein n=1 Tax=Tunturiibacter gelidiferens TaxID=3069689 RepID=A0ACC5NVG6_9BACT|nr:glycosyl hydrolase family 28-related protein [Edaphobacter lichenicola]MBB5338424.1 hypothetical protein [Edaphobacter lichenicola]
MKRPVALFLLLFLTGICAQAATYTATATHLTMHAGDPLPPLIFKLSSYSGPYAALFKGQPKLSTSATSSSPPGNYPIKIAAGSMTTVNRADSLTFVDGTLAIIPADGIGARLTNNIVYPPGFTSAAAFPIIDVTHNPIANLVGDGVTDNTAGLQKLFAFGRGAAQSKVTTSVSGNTYTVTQVGESVFTGLAPGSPIRIAGVIYTIAAVLDPQHLTLTTNPGTLSNVAARLPPNVVSTSGTTVTATSGPTFAALKPNASLQIGSAFYKVASVTDATHLELTTTPPSLKNVDMYYGAAAGGQLGALPMFLYFPPGVYLASDTIIPYGNYWSIYGAGAQTSVIKLAPNSAAFNTGTAPVQFFSPLSVNKNDNFHIFIQNIGFESGVGNPNAEIFTTQVNNIGAIRNVQVWSDDSNCVNALNIRRAYPGPGMMRNVAVYGCQNGIYSNQQEYNFTFEDITLEGQTVAGIGSTNMKFSIRHLLSDNNVPALQAELFHANTTIMDSELFGDNSTGIGLQNGKENGPQGCHLYTRNVKVVGYATSEADYCVTPSKTYKGDLAETWSGEAQTVFDQTAPPASLHLPESETPQPNDPDPRTWTMLGTSPATWAAIISGSKSPTVYAPPGQYGGNGAYAITVPDTVNHLQFFNAMPTPGRTYTINLTIAGSSKTPLIIEGCPNNACVITHTGSRTLVLIDDNTYNYSTAAGAGNLYIDDVILGSNNNPGNTVTFYPGQQIWARQLDEEPARADKITCNGCTLWILGYKTEHNGTDIVATNAQIEIFGFFYYKLSLAAPDSTTMQITDSNLFATGYENINIAGYGAPNWVIETRNGTTSHLVAPGVNSPQHLHVFYSYGGKKASTTPVRKFHNTIQNF